MGSSGHSAFWRCADSPFRGCVIRTAFTRLWTPGGEPFYSCGGVGHARIRSGVTKMGKVILCLGVCALLVRCLGEDCGGPLTTEVGERLAVSITSSVRICTPIPLAVGDRFVIDMGEISPTTFDSVCATRTGALVKLPDVYGKLLSKCEPGPGGGPQIRCTGADPTSGCVLEPRLSFPFPPADGRIQGKGQLVVNWAPSCWPDVCGGVPTDEYNVTIERVGMGWVPPSN